MLLFFSSCDDFLDGPAPQDALSVEEVFETATNIERIFAGIYRTFRSYGGSHSATGYGAILNTRNVSGNDIMQLNVTHFNAEYKYEVQGEPSSGKSGLGWNMFYSLIDQTNLITDRVPGAPVAVSEEEKKHFLAEARALRAFFYYELLLEYAQPYLKDQGASLGVPVYRRASEIDVSGKPRSTVAEVYEHIIADLVSATSVRAGLSVSRRLKSSINLEVASGILARVYLSKGDYVAAASLAKKARGSYKLNVEEYVPGFDNIDSPEWMWGTIQTQDQSQTLAAFASIWQSVKGKKRYPSVTVNPTLYELFEETDVRKKTFDEKTVSTIFPNKFEAGTSSDEDMPLMRVSEMYLIEAEALARNGQEVLARDLLYELQKNRDKEAKKSSNTGNLLIDEILTERRKELWGEGLADFADNRRLNKAWQRDSNHPAIYRFSFKEGDNCFNYQIPTDEIEVNKDIGKRYQNPVCKASK